MTIFWTDIYQDHFQKYFGKPFDVQVFHDASGASLKLATHDWALAGFRVYASTGIADRLARDGEEAVGEVLVYSDVSDPEVPRLFVTSLFFILQNKIPLTSRFSVSFSSVERAFSRRCDKTALYFTRAFSPDGAFNEVGKLARVYQVFFISAEEDAFLDQNGPAVFEEKFWAQLGEDFRRDEALRPPVDLAEMEVYKKRVNELWTRAARLFSVRRPSCV